MSGNWFLEGILGVLYLTLGLIVVLIGYRFYMKWSGKGRKSEAIYFKPDPLKNRLIIGNFESYIELDEPAKVKVYLADLNGEEKFVIWEKNLKKGLTPIAFDSTQYPDGEYFYTLISDDMKSEKKIKLQNQK
ncbi:MAG: hypothetical protein R2799_09945 [Crocinitomicaceae bacterium]